jgi:hypothetical protein
MNINNEELPFMKNLILNSYGSGISMSGKNVLICRPDIGQDS